MRHHRKCVPGSISTAEEMLGTVYCQSSGLLSREQCLKCCKMSNKVFIAKVLSFLNTPFMNDFSYTSGCHRFLLQTSFILLIFHGTSLYAVNILFDVSDVLTFQKHAWLRNRYVWSSLVFVLVAAIITAVVVALSEAESRSVPPSKAQLCYV